MVRATKTNATKANSTKATVELSVEVPVIETKPKKSSKKEPVAKSAVVVEQPTDVVEAVVLEEPKQITVKVGEFGAKLQQVLSMLSALKTEYKVIEKNVAKEMRIATKAINKKKRNNINRKPSGIIKPTRISDELAKFLGKEIGTELARTAVSKEINVYINKHSLKDVKNGRIIHPDAKLTKLLNVLPGDELTYFNLQRYMKHHFSKETKA